MEEDAEYYVTMHKNDPYNRFYYTDGVFGDRPFRTSIYPIFAIGLCNGRYRRNFFFQDGNDQ